MIRYSIVIPCYNEEKNIPLILSTFEKAILRKDVEVLLVNNGSTDQSETVMKQLVPSYSFARIIHVPQNQGYGYGILQGLKEAKGEWVGWTHADMQTHPKDVMTAIEILASHPNPRQVYVKGNRKKRPWFDQLFTNGMSVFESVYLRTRLWDINAQPNVFPRSFFEKWTNAPHDFSLDLYALYQAQKEQLELLRFPVLFPERIHGTSSWNTGLQAKWKFIKRTFDFSLKLKKELRK